MLSVSPALRKQIGSSIGPIVASLAVNSLVGAAGNTLLAKLPNDEKKEYGIHFAQIFSAMLAAIFTSRAFSNGALKLASWSEARQAINSKSLLLALGVSALNVFIEYLADLASKAQEASEGMQKIIKWVEVGLKVVGSFSVARLIGGANPDATVGAIANSCPCCGFTVCLLDVIAIAQGLFQSVSQWLSNIFSPPPIKSATI